MLMTMVTGTLLALALQQTDTTVSVPANARLDMNLMGGEIVVRTWDRSSVRVQAEHSTRTRVEVSIAGAVVTVKAKAQHGPANVIDYRLTVPANMALNLSGLYTDITVEGSKGNVKLGTVDGDIIVRRAEGQVKAHSVQGDVLVEGGRGEIQAESVSNDVRVVGASGNIVAEAVSGNVILERIESKSVDAATVSGNVLYTGSIRSGGTYSLVTHSGNVTVGIPEDADATVTVATVSGAFEPGFPIPATEGIRRGRRFSFVLGSGSARVELESFSGNVRVARPSSIRSKASQ